MFAVTEAIGFREVKAEILRRITQGIWPPGSLLPGELALAEEFACARATVNRALRELDEAGLLDRKRKAGTRVRLAPLRQARFEMPIVRLEIERTGARYRYVLIKKELLPAPDWLAARLHLGQGSTALHLLCLHLADGQPWQLEDRWINAQALPQVLDQDFHHEGPNEWLIRAVPYSEVEVSFLAAAAAAEEVTHLGFDPGDPVFRVERMTWWQSVGITHVTLSHRRGHRMTTRY
ncbi:GntR family transcriptional regulator [Neogemmobacter tilapiae]|uniref:GntR family transcriptional regulator n=1 Tax=Neogemmobacter tilapiae TaxID=875041 RepID=A0A918TJC8_9RHOB|nr:GntR family transcriptional regulator [Gemmobacter tilapiae]GHC50654.1 GntR family transcriptional regulator [Gemmobacter tilapiae]